MHPSVACPSARRVLATVLVAASYPAIISSAQSTSATRGPSTALAHPKMGTAPPLPDTPMPLVAPVFLQTDQIDSSITVVNSVTQAVNGTVTLRDQQGDVIGQQTISFPAHSSTPVTTQSILSAAGSQAHSGSVTLLQDPAVKGPALVAQLSMTLHSGSQPSFLEEEFGMPTPHGSQALQGVASQTKNLPLIAITSVSEAAQTIQANCPGENKQPSSIQLPAYGTAVVQACSWQAIQDNSLNLASSFLTSGGNSDTDHAISLKTDSIPGAFYAFGFALNGSFDQPELQPLDFYDPGMTRSTSTVYVGVPVGATSVLPAVLSPPVLTLANFSSQSRQTTVALSDSSSGTPKTQSVVSVTLAPFSTKTVVLSAVTTNGLLNTFTIKSDGNPGDVQAHLFTRLGSSQQRTELLAKDAKDDHNAGDHPWSLANGDNSTLLLFNTANQLTTFEVRISGSGSTWQQVYQLAGNETRSLSIRDIVAKGTPDYKGNKLPTALNSGEIQWWTSRGSMGLGRLLVTNTTKSLARNFSCQQYDELCSASFGSDNFEDIQINSDGTLSGVSADLCTEYSPTSCQYTSLQGTSYSATTNWSGGNSSTTSVVSSQQFMIQLQGISLGSFAVSAVEELGDCESAPMGGGGTVRNCVDPTGETTTGMGANVDPNFSYEENFVMTLQGPSGSSWDGEQTQEMPGQPGTDSCYFSGSTIPPQTQVTGGRWIVGTSSSSTVQVGHNQWGADTVGPSSSTVQYYQYNERSHGGTLPCGSTWYQEMQIVCANQIYGYVNDTLTYSIDVGGVTDCRAGNCFTTLNH